MGDGIQAAKAGILEIGDLFVINKADRDGADQVRRELRSMIALAERPEGAWKPQIVKTVASKGEGVDDVRRRHRGAPRAPRRQRRARAAPAAPCPRRDRGDRRHRAARAVARRPRERRPRRARRRRWWPVTATPTPRPTCCSRASRPAPRRRTRAPSRRDDLGDPRGRGGVEEDRVVVHVRDRLDGGQVPSSSSYAVTASAGSSPGAWPNIPSGAHQQVGRDAQAAQRVVELVGRRRAGRARRCGPPPPRRASAPRPAVSSAS